MLNLLKIEWLKIKTYRTFWVLFLCFVIFYPASFFFTASKFMSSRDITAEERVLKGMLGAPFSFPGAWLSSAYFAGIFFIIIGMLFILLITNEVQYRTHRQNIIDGWSRMNFLMAKASVMIVLVLVATLLVAVCGYFVGNKYAYDSSSNASEGLQYIGYFAIMALLYLMVAFLIAILIKRTGLAIIIYFAVVCILDNILWLTFYAQDSQIAHFMPLEVVDALVPNPFKPKALERRTVADSTLIIAAFAYMSLYAYVIINRFKNTDLKT
jgi:ABC-2 type transport system permease protein